METSCLKAGYMLSDRYKNLASEMTTLLYTRLLVFNMDTSCTGIDEHLDKFHDRSDTAETCISIGNAWD